MKDDTEETCWYKFIHQGETYYSPVTPHYINRKHIYIGPDKNGSSLEEQEKCKLEYLKNTKNLQIDEGLIGRVPQFECTTLSSGTYVFLPENHPLPPRFLKINLTEDKTSFLSDLTQDIELEINKFFNSEEKYREMGILFKRGLLFYGPPGNGKTTFIKKIANKLNKNSINIILSGVPPVEVLNKIKETLKNEMKIFIFEELSTITSDPYSLDSFLSFVDGEYSVDKCLFLAATNYPELLPGNVVDRPSRFDKLVSFHNPSSKDRAILLEQFLKRSITKKEISDTHDFSVAAIKELCILIITQDKTFAEALESLKKHSRDVKNHFKKQEKLGI